MRTILAAALAAVCCMTSGVFAELKIGYINSQTIFAKYDGTKDAQDKFNKDVAKWEQDASTRQKEIRALKDQLEKQSLILSLERKKEIEDSLRGKIAAYDKFVQEKFGQKGEALTKNEELTKPIVEKINKILERIAKEENYDFIFDQRAGGIVQALPKYDLTERVLLLLNKEK